MFQNFPKRTGVYNIRDNIECLELELHFRHINSLLKLPKFDLAHINAPNNSTSVPSKKYDETFGLAENVTSVTRIHWQEKLLSPSEVELYKDARNCVTDAQKGYNQWILELEAEEDSGNALTVVEGGKHSRKSKRSKNLPKTENILKKRWGEIFTYTHADNFKPEHSEQSRHATESEQRGRTSDVHEALIRRMYVYAAILPDTQLVSLLWDPKLRQLRIYPDFNVFTENPYYIEIDTDYRHLYAYAIHNISKRRCAISPAPYLQLPEWVTHWQEERDLNNLFAMPPKRTRRICLLFELRTAAGFSYANIHARYHVQLPANTLLEEGVLHGSTHTSSPSHNNNECYFGYNWQITLLCEEEFNPAHLFHIYFELISIDSWGRERIEGYAHYSTYLLAGWNSEVLQCLRPAEGLIEAISRYLIGGRRSFDFMRFYTDDSTDSQCKTRYGCRMQSTGQIELTCQRFTQRNCELLQPCSNRASGMTLDDIMLAYREARRRLEAVVLK
ncbi:Meckel syndrome type 1 protein [Ceratitis capitata]|uniref:Meckel syndrome type 1 protein n=1 Tax=Ceratitis capitata TaxID=7213 RepID=UPI0003297E2E|nr:Meckel syndrome type 1 protein [Ceratitis capitata]